MTNPTRAAVTVMPLRGREAAWTTVLADFALVAAGRSVVRIVAGEPGVGKTRFLREALREAMNRRWLTVELAADPDAALLPLSTFLAGFGPFIGDAEPWATGGGSADRRLNLAMSCADMIERHPEGTLVVVDDAQWCDGASAAVLRTMIRRLEGTPVYWLCAVRSTGADRPAVPFAMSEREPVQLEPVSDAAAERIAEDILGAPLDTELKGCLSRCDRMPLLIAEMLAALADTGSLVRHRGVVGVTDSGRAVAFGESVKQRLALLGRDHEQIVELAAVLGRRFRLDDLVALASSLGYDAAVPSVRKAIDAGLLDERADHLEFHHDVIREVAERGLPQPIRRVAIKEAIRIRLDTGADVLSIAAAAGAAVRADDPASIDLLVECALRLAPADARAAATLAANAMATIGEDLVPWAHRLIDVMPVLWAGGRTRSMSALAQRLRPHLDGAQRARMELITARALSEAAFKDAVDAADRGLRCDDASATVRRDLLAIRILAIANTGDHARVLRELPQAYAGMGSEPTPALATVQAVESVSLLSAERFDAALLLCQRSRLTIGHATERDRQRWYPECLWETFLHDSLGDCAEALRLARDGLASANRIESATGAAYWSMVSARVSYDLGDLDEAQARAEAVYLVADEVGLGEFADATAGVVLFRCALHRGGHQAGLPSDLSCRMSAAGGASSRAAQWLAALSYACQGRPQDAIDQLDDIVTALRDERPLMSTPVDFADDVHLARMARDARRTDVLRAVVERSSRRAGRNPENLLARAVAAHVRALADDDPLVARDAIECYRRLPRALVLADALADLGVLDDGDGRVAAWREAAERYERAGAVHDAGRVRAWLRGIGVRSRPVVATVDRRHGLTAREWDVVVRVADGRTTDEIARELVISPHTVITHIRHVYDKWLLNSRKEIQQRVRELNASLPGEC
ncbi:BREX system ATP-binding domain-containing protein [Mycolicibacterium sp. ELW1]|uniref:BREX system ATP-binding domain-containing protein n=1 Tax=Mycobacteriaceae TaxID=1762 RepID=UPI0011ED951C|nr:LuxR family transcriptional regulator [Mycobacterium sp. ELW1]QEN14625.1 hypothetical protein D3H54_16390 [Mycobacterium sp. ELW1]